MDLNKIKNPVVLIILFIIIGSALFTIISSRKQKKLDVYTNSDVVPTEEATTEEKVIESFTYEDESSHFKIDIPEGWEKVTKDGYTTYIHTPSASSVQIQVSGYEPAINLVSSDSISSSVVENGYTFINYTRLGNCSYEVIYQDLKKNEYDYFEEVHWNQDNIVKLVCTCNDKNYEKILPYFENIINSFEWTMDSIPEQYALFYIEYGDFEFGYPADWVISSTDNSIVAVNQDSTAQMIITVQEYPSNMENFTATDMTGLISGGKNGFMLKEFSNTVSTAESVASYYDAGGQPMVNRTYLVTSGFYLYSIQFDYYNGAVDESMPDECRALFREFATEKIIEEQNMNNTEEPAESSGDLDEQNTSDETAGTEEVPADTEISSEEAVSIENSSDNMDNTDE